MKIQIKIENYLGTMENSFDSEPMELTNQEEIITAFEWLKKCLSATVIEEIDWSLAK